MSRGDLRWRISLRDDGALPDSGALPVLIEWPGGPHPSPRMPDLGVRLERLSVRHLEPSRLTTQLTALGAVQLVTVAHGSDALAIELEMRTAQRVSVTLR